ncbi:hypothetical protein NL676_015785 [Syzygium grande]|nr:hypothetical protein NL676_015785 [Syzygium grande]
MHFAIPKGLDPHHLSSSVAKHTQQSLPPPPPQVPPPFSSRNTHAHGEKHPQKFSMASEISQDFSPFLRIYEDSRIERLIGTATVPTSLDDELTGVASKDVAISSDPAVSARLYLPSGRPEKPPLVYFHGGSFCIETASSPTYHNYLNAVASEAGVVVVSVEYRRAPEDPLPPPTMTPGPPSSEWPPTRPGTAPTSGSTSTRT